MRDFAGGQDTRLGNTVAWQESQYAVGGVEGFGFLDFRLKVGTHFCLA